MRTKGVVVFFCLCPPVLVLVSDGGLVSRREEGST